MNTKEQPTANISASTEPWLHLTFVLMTVVTGLVDAASYLGMGRVFTANMTGNVVLLGFALARTPGPSVGRSLAALGGALLGGVVAGRPKKNSLRAGSASVAHHCVLHRGGTPPVFRDAGMASR